MLWCRSPTLLQPSLLRDQSPISMASRLNLKISNKNNTSRYHILSRNVKRFYLKESCINGGILFVPPMPSLRWKCIVILTCECWEAAKLAAAAELSASYQPLCQVRSTLPSQEPGGQRCRLLSDCDRHSYQAVYPLEIVASYSVHIVQRHVEMTWTKNILFVWFELCCGFTVWLAKVQHKLFWRFKLVKQHGRK